MRGRPRDVPVEGFGRLADLTRILWDNGIPVITLVLRLFFVEALTDMGYGIEIGGTWVGRFLHGLGLSFRGATRSSCVRDLFF